MMRSGFRPGEQLRDRGVLGADQRVGGQPHVVEEDLELALGADRSPSRSGCSVKPGASVGTTNSAGRSVAGLGVLGAADDQHRLGLVDAGDEDLLALEDPVAAVAARGGGDLVRVRPGVGFGDGERHGHRAVGDAGHPALLLLVGAELGDDRAVDGRRDHHHQQRRSPRRPSPP